MKKTLFREMKREGWIDSCKAIAIILVILGHTYSIPEWMYVVIYAFHMPLFFLVSGMLFNWEKYGRGTFANYFIIKFKAYVVPYIHYALINLVLQMLYRFAFLRESISINYILHNLKGILLCYATMETMPNCSPLWFLICLFLASMLFWWIINYAEKQRLILASLCVGLSYYLYLYVDIWFPWTIATVPMAVFFMCIGYEIKQREMITRLINGKYQSLSLAVMIVVGVVAALKNGKNVGMSSNEYGNLILFLVASLALSVTLLGICRMCSSLQSLFLLWLGRNTIFVIAFNYFIRDLSTEIYYLIPYVRKIPLCWEVSFSMILLGCIGGIKGWNWIKDSIRFRKI